MSYFDGILLGIIQALTEFLPISSSGHLVIAKYFFNIVSNDLIIEIILHLGTLLSIIIYFFNDIKELLKKIILKKDLDSILYCFYLIIATIPAGLMGIFFKSKITTYYYNIQTVSFAIIFTGIILFFTKLTNKRNHITWIIALSIGIVQVIALIPGVSRSGITIAMGMYLGLKNSEAVKFSFLLGIPIMLGAGIIEIYSLNNFSLTYIGPLIVGFITALLIGLITINILYNLIKKHKFWMFSIYCWILGIILILTN